MFYDFVFVFSYDEESMTWDKGYPRPIADDFMGIGEKVDAAYRKNGKYWAACVIYASPYL